MAIATNPAPYKNLATPAAAGGQMTYNLVGYAGAGKSQRLEITSTPSTPETLEITARTEGSGANKRHVRIATLRKTKVNATLGPEVCSVTFTVRMPDTADFTSNEVAIQAQLLLNFLCTGTHLESIIRGEV